MQNCHSNPWSEDLLVILFYLLLWIATVTQKRIKNHRATLEERIVNKSHIFVNIQKTNSTESHKPQTQPSRSLPLRERQLFRGPCFFYRLRAGLCYFLSTTERPASPFRPLGTPEKWDRRKNPLAIKKELPEGKKAVKKEELKKKVYDVSTSSSNGFYFFLGLK